MFRKRFAFALILVTVQLTLAGRAETSSEGDYLSYAIPAGAQRVGPLFTQEPFVTVITYYPPEAKRSRGNEVGREMYYNDTRIRLDLFKDGKNYGIQKEWYPTGQLKSEAPFRNGIMDGVFKHFDESGKLVGQYRISNGTGVERIYDSGGNLVREVHYKDNKMDGLDMQLLSVRKERGLSWYTSGQPVGNYYMFYSNGNLDTIGWFGKAGQLHGPVITFNEDGTLQEKSWYISRSVNGVNS